MVHRTYGATAGVPAVLRTVVTGGVHDGVPLAAVVVCHGVVHGVLHLVVHAAMTADVARGSVGHAAVGVVMQPPAVMPTNCHDLLLHW